MTIISASILSADFTHLEDQMKEAERGGVDHFHFDIMDGSFVPNITMGPFVLESVRKITDLPFDAHLMIEHPDRFVEAFIQAGANQLAVHIENNPNVLRTVQHIRHLGCSPTVVLNPATPPEHLSAILPFVDNVLVMTVNPGFSGQVFIPEMLPKIRKIHQMILESHLPVKIQVDGGINVQNIAQVVNAGVELIVAATAVFKYPQGIAEGIKALRTSIGK